MDNKPVYELEDRLIHITEEEAAAPEDDFPYERVVKQRFWDVDDEQYWYGIGIESIPESYDVYDEPYLQEHYREVTEGDDDRV